MGEAHTAAVVPVGQWGNPQVGYPKWLADEPPERAPGQGVRPAISSLLLIFSNHSPMLPASGLLLGKKDVQPWAAPRIGWGSWVPIGCSLTPQGRSHEPEGRGLSFTQPCCLRELQPEAVCLPSPGLSAWTLFYSGQSGTGTFPRPAPGCWNLPLPNAWAHMGAFSPCSYYSRCFCKRVRSGCTCSTTFLIRI